MRCFLFRIDSGTEVVRNEIKAGRLRQGWGKEDMYLKKDEDVVSKDEWVKNFPKEWGGSLEYIERKYNNLKIMLDIKKDDIIIIPKYPSWNSFSVVKALDRYNFQMPGSDDFGHYINIDLKTLRSFNYEYNNFTKAIHSKLRGYQSPLNNVRSGEIFNAAKELLNMESTEESIKIEDIVKYNFENELKEIKESLYKVSARDIERIVEKLFLKQGYSIEHRNKYDRKGGDADLILVRRLPILDEIDELNSYDKIYIQVKHKNGDICGDREGIDQLNKIVKTIEKDCNNIYKVLVCTSLFSDELKELAVQENIILIDGLQLTRLIIKYL